MSTYATVAANLQPRVAGRTLDATSSPTSTQALTWIEEAEAMVVGALTAAQCAIPAAGSSGAKIIASWVCDYAEAHCRMAWVAAIGGGGEDGSKLLEAFDKRLDAIAENPARYDAMLNGGGTDSSRRVRSHILDNTDGDTVEDGDFGPWFEFDVTDPSSEF